MIFVTGDCHGKFHRFNKERFPDQLHMTKNDYVIICGDFGGIWCQQSDLVQQKTEKYWLRWLYEKPFTTLFVDGNHENHARLNDMPVSEWHGGKIHKVWDSVYHLMRGEIYEIEGKRFFTFGGASSHDISDGIIDGSDPDWRRQAIRMEMNDKYMYRVKGISWWEEELPSEAEMQNGLDNLARYDNKVDYIITHCAGSTIQNSISDIYPNDRLTDYLDQIRRTVSYERWYFGHYHEDFMITPKDYLMHDEIYELKTN